MSDGLRTQLTTSATQIDLKLSGPIGENVNLPKIEPGLPLRIDFSGVTRVNSRGIKQWCLWIAQFKPPAAVHFDRVPSVVVKSFNLVKGCIPPGVQVDSFYVPLYSPTSGERRDFLLTRGKEYDKNMVSVPAQKDSKGHPMEVDVHESYWEFLGR